MQNSFTVSENEIAQYVINNPDDVTTISITAIAANTNTSEASINRFCKKLGFKGFNRLKIALAQEAFYDAMNRESDEPSLIASVKQDYGKMIANTSAMLNESDVIQAAERLKSSPRVYIFANAVTQGAALDIEFRLTTVGVAAKAITDLDFFRVVVSNIQSEETALLVVPSVSRPLYQAALTAKDRGAFVIAAISCDSPKLNDALDFKFVASDKIIARNSVSLSANMMFLFVMDVLFSAMLKNDKSLRKKKLNSDAAIMGSSQMVENYMLDY
jgi:DNA-binding MurR/RpiR family transcriptional regulator